MNEVQSSVDRKKHVLYPEAIFIKAYNHLGTAVEQVSVVIDSLEAVE
jgi:hypothetical protein